MPHASGVASFETHHAHEDDVVNWCRRALLLQIPPCFNDLHTCEHTSRIRYIRLYIDKKYKNEIYDLVMIL